MLLTLFHQIYILAMAYAKLAVNALHRSEFMKTNQSAGLQIGTGFNATCFAQVCSLWLWLSGFESHAQ